MGKKSSENIFKGEAAVGYKLYVTINTGNYENAKSEISVAMPCAPTLKSVDETFKAIRKNIIDKMKVEVKELRKAAGI